MKVKNNTKYKQYSLSIRSLKLLYVHPHLTLYVRYMYTLFQNIVSVVLFSSMTFSLLRLY